MPVNVGAVEEVCYSMCNSYVKNRLMKKTTCRDLRGACDQEITGVTPEEMGQHSHQHVMAMIAAGDEPHRQAMASMKALSPADQQQWYAEFAQRFPNLPDA